MTTTKAPAPIKLSDNFTSAEVACPCCGIYHVDMRLINALEELRAKVNKPLKILSGYRCVNHNKKVGGAQASEHVLGTAADVALPKGMSLKAFFQAAEAVPAFASGGIGVYPDEAFLHVDIRAKKARWSRVNGKYLAVEVAFNKSLIV